MRDRLKAQSRGVLLAGFEYSLKLCCKEAVFAKSDSACVFFGSGLTCPVPDSTVSYNVL